MDHLNHGEDFFFKRDGFLLFLRWTNLEVAKKKKVSRKKQLVFFSKPRSIDAIFINDQLVGGICPSPPRKRVREQRPGFESLIKTLEQYPAGSVLRATAFFQEFLKNGINGDGHVKPQVEYLGQSQGCSIPMRFVGRVENITIDWPRSEKHAENDKRCCFRTNLHMMMM